MSVLSFFLTFYIVLMYVFAGLKYYYFLRAACAYILTLKDDPSLPDYEDSSLPDYMDKFYTESGMETPWSDADVALCRITKHRDMVKFVLKSCLLRWAFSPLGWPLYYVAVGVVVGVEGIRKICGGVIDLLMKTSGPSAEEQLRQKEARIKELEAKLQEQES